jgi:hypothetical protein
VLADASQTTLEQPARVNSSMPFDTFLLARDSYVQTYSLLFRTMHPLRLAVTACGCQLCALSAVCIEAMRSHGES